MWIFAPMLAKIASLLACFLLLPSLLLTQNAPHPCDFDRQLKPLLNKPEYIEFEKEFEAAYRQYRPEKSQTVFVVPTVVHVIYGDGTQNISEAQIQSQLNVLNKDFRKQNADTALVDPQFSVADAGIEFCLAQRDPQGDKTTGITRNPTNLSFTGTNNEYFKIQPAWDPDRYLNIWVGRYAQNGQILGFATPPNWNVRNQVGVYIDFEVFGTIGTASKPGNDYDRGRSAVHEVGHWLNLLHPWGSTTQCGSTDFVADTPEQEGELYNCPSSHSSCGSEDVVRNYMQYVDDRCMGHFTDGQAERMRFAFIEYRSGILLSKGCIPVGLEEADSDGKIRIFPNPVKDQLYLSVEKVSTPFVVQIYDMNGSLVSKELVEPHGLLKIEVRHLKPAAYLLQLQGVAGNSYHRFIRLP
jgi:hypothetical protein